MPKCCLENFSSGKTAGEIYHGTENLPVWNIRDDYERREDIPAGSSGAGSWTALKLFRFEGADGKYICEAHQHSSVEIFALREGKVDFYLGDKKYVLPAGKFIIVNSNEVHSIHTSGRNEAIVLQIPMEKQIMRFSGEKGRGWKTFALLEKMYRQQIRKEYGYELLMQSIFYQLKYLLVTAYRIPEEKEGLLSGEYSVRTS